MFTLLNIKLLNYCFDLQKMCFHNRLAQDVLSIVINILQVSVRIWERHVSDVDALPKRL